MRHQRRDFRSRCTRNKSLDVPDPKSRSGAAIFMETRLGILFLHGFCNKSPHAESVILHFSKRSVEAVLRPRSITNSKKTTFFQKKRCFFCFLRLVGFCNGYLNTFAAPDLLKQLFRSYIGAGQWAKFRRFFARVLQMLTVM